MGATIHKGTNCRLLGRHLFHFVGLLVSRHCGHSLGACAPVHSDREKREQSRGRTRRDFLSTFFPTLVAANGCGRWPLATREKKPAVAIAVWRSTAHEVSSFM